MAASVVARRAMAWVTAVTSGRVSALTAMGWVTPAVTA
jgi:hypothetical protein